MNAKEFKTEVIKELLRIIPKLPAGDFDITHIDKKILNDFANKIFNIGLAYGRELKEYIGEI